MKGMAVVVCILCTLGVICSAQIAQETEALLTGVAFIAQGLQLVTDKGCGETYREGESISISVTSPIDGYLYLLDFQADGKVVMMLFPCRSFWKDFPVTVKANTKLTIPPEVATTKLTISPPFGKELLFAFVVPEERADLIKIFDANNADEHSYLTEQGSLAGQLAAVLIQLRASGVNLVAGICTYYAAPAAANSP